jgi:hypothetical protein
MQHAVSVLPESRSDWGLAMTNELEHVEGDFTTLRWATDCVLASYIERGGSKMDRPANSFIGIVRKPSALVPLAMSLTALGVIGVAAMSGRLVQRPDEGAEAHIWQLLMAGQLPVLAFFAVKWLPRAPKQALCVLGLQVAAVLAALAPVYLLHL